MAVTWTDGALARPGPARAAQVIAAARELGVHFPEDFLAVAMRHPGAEPIPSGFQMPNGFVYAVEHLLHFEPDSFANIVTRRFPLRDVMPETVVPFAEASGGDLVCFDYSRDPEAPTVAFWSVDTGLVPLASSFTAFLELLSD